MIQPEQRRRVLASGKWCEMRIAANGTRYILCPEHGWYSSICPKCDPNHAAATIHNRGGFK